MRLIFPRVLRSILTQRPQKAQETQTIASFASLAFFIYVNRFNQ